MLSCSDSQGVSWHWFIRSKVSNIAWVWSIAIVAPKSLALKCKHYLLVPLGIVFYSCKFADVIVLAYIWFWEYVFGLIMSKFDSVFGGDNANGAWSVSLVLLGMSSVMSELRAHNLYELAQNRLGQAMIYMMRMTEWDLISQWTSQWWEVLRMKVLRALQYVLYCTLS